jgi:hypothetical protein
MNGRRHVDISIKRWHREFDWTWEEAKRRCRKRQLAHKRLIRARAWR